MHQQRGGGRIADAHLAEHQRVAGGRHDAFHQAMATLQGVDAVGLGHRRLFDEVAGAVPNLRLDQARMGAARAVDAGINHPQVDAVQFREHTDRGASLQEIGDHLRRHLAWIGADAALRRAMIGGEHDTGRVSDLDGQGALDRAQLGGERLETAERTARLGQRVQPPVGGRAAYFIDGRDRGEW